MTKTTQAKGTRTDSCLNKFCWQHIASIFLLHHASRGRLSQQVYSLYGCYRLSPIPFMRSWSCNHKEKRTVENLSQKKKNKNVNARLCNVTNVHTKSISISCPHDSKSPHRVQKYPDRNKGIHETPCVNFMKFISAAANLV